MIGHVLFEDGDPDRPDQICDVNGQTALACCKLCGAYESDLSEYPTCDEYEQRLISNEEDLSGESLASISMYYRESV